MAKAEVAAGEGDAIETDRLFAEADEQFASGGNLWVVSCRNG